MTRLHEAVLAFIGAGEVEGKPLSLARLQEREADRERIGALFAEGMIEARGDALICSVKAWNLLDSRKKLDA